MPGHVASLAGALCRVLFNATDVDGDLVVPAGSAWRRCPIPRAPWAWAATGPSFEPACAESEACSSYHGPAFSGPGCGTDRTSCSTGTFPCECSGWGVGDLFRLEIVDRLRLPKDLEAGEWVFFRIGLGFDRGSQRSMRIATV